MHGIKGRCGLVRKHHFGGMRQGGGNGDPLALAHRKGGRILFKQAPDTEAVHDALNLLAAFCHAPQTAATQHDVVASGQKGQQATCLLYIAKMALSQAGQGVQVFFAPFFQHVVGSIWGGAEQKAAFPA